VEGRELAERECAFRIGVERLVPDGDLRVPKREFREA
jgi:hypothetical protein